MSVPVPKHSGKQASRPVFPPFLAIPFNGFRSPYAESVSKGAFGVSVSGGKNPLPNRARRGRKPWDEGRRTER
jgi:hypothetical protein